MVDIMSISNDLIEAYKGYYEDEYDREQQFHTGNSTSAEPALFEGWCRNKIMRHTAKQRLEVYCQWNGLIGYSNRLYEIATGDI